MKLSLFVSILVSVGVLWSATPTLAEGASSEEIDRTVWSVVSRTVVEQDIEGMAGTYHPDAVLVSGRGTVPIADQLPKWGQGMEDQKAAGGGARVSFRFGIRQDGEATAFESGMFKYTEIDSSGNESSAYVPFEALLVKKNDRWLIVMERQFEPADQAAWGAMKSTPK